jgi:hypothetical protein
MNANDENRVRTAIRKGGLIALLLPIAFAGIWCIWLPCHFFTGFIFQNYVTFFILPYGAFFAYFLVLTLEHSRGPIELDFMTLKFKGAAGPIVFWLMIFLALVLALKLLWVPPDIPHKCAPEATISVPK